MFYTFNFFLVTILESRHHVFNLKNNMKIWEKTFIFIKKSEQHKHMKIHCSCNKQELSK